MDATDPYPGGLQQISNARGRESKKIVRLLMLLPHMRYNDVDHTARLQHSLKLFNHPARPRRVFQNHDRQHMIERCIWKRQILEPADDVELRVIPGGVSFGKIHRDVFRMRKQIFESALARSSVEH